MGEVTAADALLRLRALNPDRPVEVLVRYADAFAQYHEAADNLARNGIITAHPRTGAPLENPYLKVRNAASEILASIKLNTEGLWP